MINAVSPDTGAWIQFLVVDALDIVGELVRVAVVGEHLLAPAEAPRGHHRHHRAQHRVRRVHREHRVVLQRGNLTLYIATSLSPHLSLVGVVDLVSERGPVAVQRAVLGRQAHTQILPAIPVRIIRCIMHARYR